MMGLQDTYSTDICTLIGCQGRYGDTIKASARLTMGLD